MSVTTNKLFQLSHLFAVDATLTVYHEQELCTEAKKMDSEAVEAERNRVNQLVTQRRYTREENTDVPPIVNLQEFIEIFSSDVKAGMAKPIEYTEVDSKQGYIHIGNPPDFYVSLSGSEEWKIVDLAEVIRRQMNSGVTEKRNAILDGVQSNRIQVDKVQHIIINGINAIYYNSEPERKDPNALPPAWRKIDLTIDYKTLQDEHAALKKKVAEQEQIILQQRYSLDALRPVEKSILSHEEQKLAPKGKAKASK